MLIRSSFGYLLARGLPGLLNLAALALYSRLLAPQEYGRYTLVLAGTTLVSVVVFQWQRLIVARWLPARRADPHRFLGEMLSVFGGLTLAVSAIGIVISALWPDPIWQRLLALAVPLLIAQSWLELNLVLASAQLAPARYGRLLSAKSLSALVVGAWLAWVGVGASAPLFGLLLGSILAVPLFGLGPWRSVEIGWPAKGELRRQLAYGQPLVIAFALGWIVASSDRLLIGWLLNVDATAMYAIGYDLAQHSLGLLLVVVNTAAYPLAVQELEVNGRAAAVAQTERNGELIFCVALGGAAGLAVLAPQIVSVFVGAHFREAAIALLPWIALAAAIGGIKAFHFDIAFHLGRSTVGLIASSAVPALANLGLNLLFIPRYGILGAAYATVLALVLGAMTSAWLGRQIFEMPPFIPICIRAGGVAVAAGAGAEVGSIVSDGLAGLLAGVASGAVFALAVALAVDIAGLRSGAVRWVRSFSAP